MRGFVESSCALYIAARSHGNGGVQHHAFKPAYAVAPYFHHPLGTIRIVSHDDPSFGGEVQIPELMASR